MKPNKTSRIVSWILSGLVFLLLVGPSAMGKFTEWEGKTEAFQKMGFTTELMFRIGILEVVIAVLYIVPRTAFLGAILLTGYLGGATVTHLRADEPFYMPIVIGVVMWVALAMRVPVIFRLVTGAPPENASESAG
jgi:multidrug efflux pump subunit AcrB